MKIWSAMDTETSEVIERINARIDALETSLRGEIRDLARALKDVQSPLPRILARTREVRERVAGIQKAEDRSSEALQRL